MANYPGSLPSSAPATHQQVNDEIVAIATELDSHKAGADSHPDYMTAAETTAAIGAAAGGGTLGYAETVTATVVTGSPAADVTGLTVTVTAIAGHRVRITGLITGQDSANSSAVIVNIAQDGAVVFSTNNQAVIIQQITYIVSCVLSPSAGSHTYKLQIGGGNGTFTTSPNATRKNYILVEDLDA